MTSTNSKVTIWNKDMTHPTLKILKEIWEENACSGFWQLSTKDYEKKIINYHTQFFSIFCRKADFHQQRNKMTEVLHSVK